MNVSLTPELERFVHAKVKSGRYLSASEVVRQALRLLEERERQRDHEVEALRAKLQIGLDQLERGEYTEYDEDGLKEMVKQIQAGGRRRLKRPRAKDRK